MVSLSLIKDVIMTGSRVATGGCYARLAQFAAGVQFEQLPSEVLDLLKRPFLDTVGTSLAGSTLGAGCDAVDRVVQAAGGTQESTVIGFGRKAPALTATLANGATANALNYDALGGDGGHLGVTTLPAPLAVAERRGGVAGKELLAAMAAAAEVTARLAGALSASGVNTRKGPLEGQVLGYFGTAAGAGRVMGLSAERMHADAQCAGPRPDASWRYHAGRTRR